MAYSRHPSQTVFHDQSDEPKELIDVFRSAARLDTNATADASFEMADSRE